MTDRPRGTRSSRGTPINPICAPQSMSAKKPMAAHSGGYARTPTQQTGPRFVTA
jgi:hypothetical protein